MLICEGQVLRPVVVGDVVFCQVQSSNNFYAHMVLDIEPARRLSGPTRYIIGNAKGHVNGWCNMWHMYGKLVKTER